VWHVRSFKSIVRCVFLAALIILLASGLDIPVEAMDDSTPSTTKVALLPECGSQDATNAVKQTLANGPDKTLNIELLDIDDPFESFFDKDKGVRECIGKAILNAGEMTLVYEFSIRKSDPTRYLIRTHTQDADVSSLIPDEKPDPGDVKEMQGVWIRDTYTKHWTLAFSPAALAAVPAYRQWHRTFTDPGCGGQTYVPGLVGQIRCVPAETTHDDRTTLSFGDKYVNIVGESGTHSVFRIVHYRPSIVLAYCHSDGKPCSGTIEIERTADGFEQEHVRLRRESEPETEPEHSSTAAPPQFAQWRIMVPKSEQEANPYLAPALDAYESEAACEDAIKHLSNGHDHLTCAIADQPAHQQAEKQEQQDSTSCGALYPCRLKAIIDDSDWQAVLSALSFGMQTGSKTQIKWTAKINKHKGYVQADTASASDPHCRVFRIVSFMGVDTGNDSVTVCRKPDGSFAVN
jgi:hypothetical protein